jgi:hypothetical protein
MKSNLKRVGVATLAFVSTAAAVGTASAQEVQAQGQTGGMALPGAGPRATAAMGESDHDAVIGTLAVGYMGRRGISVMGSAGQEVVVNAPIVGVRYWLDEMIGIDVGLGFGHTSGSFEQAGATADDPSNTAFLLHGGLPLSLADAGHFSFQIVPEMNVGFGSNSQTFPGAAPDWGGSGFHFDIGARAGAEIHFGFMGLPKLSLQGSVGLYLAHRSWSGSFDGQPGSDVSRSQLSIGTTVLDNPWNIFTSNVAALYYF